MALKARKVQQWDYAPISALMTLVPVTSVPASQDYCPDLGVYTPDYSLTPLALQPQVAIFSTDPALSDSEGQKRLGDAEWHVVVNGESKKIVTSTSPQAGEVCGAGRAGDPYDLTGGTTQGSATYGRLLVKRNFEPGENATLIFTAKLHDGRTGQTHDLRATIGISVIASWAKPSLCLDCSPIIHYNPIRSASEQLITAELFLGGAPCPSANRCFKWDTQEGDAWRELGTSVLDYWAVPAGSANEQLLLNREQMAYGAKLRCRAFYDRAGNPTGNGAMVAFREFTAVREMRGLTLDIAMAESVAAGLGSVQARAIVADGKGALTADQINKHFRVVWKTGQDGANVSNPAMAIRAEGAVADIPTAAMGQQYGMFTDCELEEKEPLKAWVETDGTILTDNDGKILLI